MKTIQHKATLFYYDGSQVFEGRDAIGGHYIAVMVEPVNERDRYLVAGVEPERLRQFRSGVIDLRSLFLERMESEWYLGIVENELDQPLTIVPQSPSLQESGFLPEPGFVLHDHPVTVETLRAARERGNLILELAVEPPEAATEHRIHVPTMIGLLAHVQTVVKHAYASRSRIMTSNRRRDADRPSAHLLDVVVPAAAGSFRVVLEAAEPLNLFRHSDIALALERVDALFDNVSDPQATLAKVKEHRGHLAGAYLRLLRFLEESGSGLHYTWAEPDFTQPRSRTITGAEVGPLVKALSTVSSLGAETVVLVGALKKADVDSGAWRLESAEGEFSGKTKPGGPTLAGLRIDSRYRFTCMEEIEELEISGREQRTLYLSEHKPA